MMHQFAMTFTHMLQVFQNVKHKFLSKKKNVTAYDSYNLTCKTWQEIDLQAFKWVLGSKHCETAMRVLPGYRSDVTVLQARARLQKRNSSQKPSPSWRDWQLIGSS